MDPKEQLLQSLMQDLQNFQLPERYSPEQKEKIMSGRKGQEQIDEGRRAIAENERLHQDARDKRSELQKQIQSLSGEIQTGKERAEAESPYEQGRQIALFGLPAGVGMGAGYLEGNSLSKALRNRATERAGNISDLAESVRTGQTPRGDAARTAKSLRLLGKTSHGTGPLAMGTLLAGVGATQRALAPELTDNPIGQDVIRGLGGLETGVGTGLAIQQIGSMMKGVPQPSAKDVAAIDTPPTTPNAPASPQPAPAAPPKPGTKAALLAEAKARELPVNSRMKKSEIEQQLAKALKANKGKRMTGGRTLKALGPIGAGLMAYDAVTSDAEAADGTLTAGNMAKGAAVGTAAGGTAYGMDRLVNALKGAAPNLTRSIGAGGVMTLPDAIGSQFDDYTQDELTSGSNKLYNQQARLQDATGLPDWLMGQNVAEARNMAQVPERNPARVYENAYQPSGEPSGYAGGTHAMPDGSVMADSEMQPPAQEQPVQEPPPDAADFEALSQAFEQDPEIADLLREYVKSRIDMSQYQ